MSSGDGKVFTTITGQDWLRSMRSGRTRRNRVVEQLRQATMTFAASGGTAGCFPGFGLAAGQPPLARSHPNTFFAPRPEVIGAAAAKHSSAVGSATAGRDRRFFPSSIHQYDHV